MRSIRSIVGTAALIGLTLAGTVGPVFAADSRFYWTGGGGDGNWHNGDNWFSEDAGATGFVPADNWVTINNGQIVNADIANGGIQPTRVVVASGTRRVPDQVSTGSSTLNVVGQSLSLPDGLEVGSGYPNVESSYTGSLNVTGGSIELEGYAWIGSSRELLNGNTVTGVVNIDGEYRSRPGTLSNLILGEYFDDTPVPLTWPIDNQSAGSSASGHVIGSLTVGFGVHGLGDIFVGRHINSDANATGSATGHLQVNAGGMIALQEIVGGELISYSYMAVGSAGLANAKATGTADITGDIVNFVELFIAYSGGDASTHASGHVTLRQGHATIETVVIAMRQFGPESSDGNLTLHHSLLDTQDLDAYEGSTLNLHLTGGSRVTPGTVGDAGTYAAIDADEALLKGTIVAHFDYVPAAGTHHYDLLVTDSLTALEDATMLPGDFQVLGLNPGFSVDFFGIVEDGVDKVRLTISGTPTLIGDLDGDGFVGIADLTIVLGAWNQGVAPGDPPSGDPSGDGFVGIEDLNTVLGNWNAGTPPAASVPEPTTSALILWGISMVSAIRRRAC